MAPEAGIAEPGEDGTLTLHCATQWPEADLRQAAAALGEPLERLIVALGFKDGWMSAVPPMI